MKARLNTAVYLMRHFGPGWLWFRLGYAFRRRAGVLKRALPATSWEQQPLSVFLSDRRLGDPERYAAFRTIGGSRFFFSADHAPSFRSQFAVWDSAGGGPCWIADALQEGVFRFFEHREINLGCPPDWHHNPITGDVFPCDRHWTEIGDFAAGDIKLVWEPSRFAWAFPLVRAYWRTGDERYPQLFWRLLDDWRTMNPPQQGVNWKCGQEVAIRLMACCFALYGFSSSSETTPQRITQLAQLMAVSAARIECNLPYALSQQNNHGISEAVGLWTVGLLFPEFTASRDWLRTARAAIEHQARDLIDDDGAFSQHSVNYQRVMLDALLWAARLGELNGQPLSPECTDRARRAGEFLWELQDDQTGQLPRYGQNDGSLLLPLTNCDATDFRPVIQTAALRNGNRRYAAGPWDEASLWLHGADSLKTDVAIPRRGDWHGAAGGYQVLRAKSGHVITRAPRYRHRPAQADALHVDVWWRGLNIAHDAGTFSYNSPPPWNNPLAATAYHNTVTVDGKDQMDRAGRFLWLPWLTGRRTALITSPSQQLAYWEGTHDGYTRLAAPVTHRRGILRIGDEHWLIIDSLASRAGHTYRLHWLLRDFPFQVDESRNEVTILTEQGDYRVRMDCAAGDGRLSVVRADDGSPRGWYAPHYAERQPSLSLAVSVDAARVMFTTLLGPGDGEVCVGPHQITAVAVGRTCTVRLAPGDGHADALVTTVTLDGRQPDRLVWPA